MTEFLANIGDRINPIAVKETRQAVNSRLVAGFLLLFLAVQLLVMLAMIMSLEFDHSSELNLRLGREMFTFVQGILLGTCMVLIPAMSGMRLAVERSDVNVDLLFISSLTPRAVLLGKLLAAGALALLIFSACAPFMTFAYVMRGLDVPTIFVVLAADYLAVLLGTMFALFLASVPANRGLRILLGAGGFGFMGYLCLGLLAGSAAFLHGDARANLSSWEFWAGFAGITALTFGGMGLLFVWSVALISPPAANRAFAVRVYTLGLWIASAIGFGIWSLYINHPEPILGWGFIGCALFSLQIGIGICERDEWGARVARRIPRNILLRVPAFFLYSGAAGGIALGVIGAALTTIGIAVWYAIVPSTSSRAEEGLPALVVGLIPAYVYCYCMTAVVFRRLLASSGFQPGITWLVAGILFGLGCVMSFIIHFAFFDDYSRRSSDDMLVLYLPNPPVMIEDAISRSSHVGLTIFFLLAWGGTVTLVNAPWLLKQVSRFHPPRANEEAGT
jgi:hypothetical protein